MDISKHGHWRDEISRGRKRERNARLIEEGIDSIRSEDSLGKTIFNVAVIGISTAILGIIGTIATRAALTMISSNVGYGNGFYLSCEMILLRTVDGATTASKAITSKK